MVAMLSFALDLLEVPWFWGRFYHRPSCGQCLKALAKVAEVRVANESQSDGCITFIHTNAFISRRK
jgi:hypothetical protein